MGRISTKATLVPLSETDIIIADPQEDIRGFMVVDQAGEEIGKVDDLLIDTEEKKVRFLQVASGGFLGLGATKLYIPVDAVTEIEDEMVHINQTKERITGAHHYDPKLSEDRYSKGLCRYYGCPPYWGVSVK